MSKRSKRKNNAEYYLDLVFFALQTAVIWAIVIVVVTLINPAIVPNDGVLPSLGMLVGLLISDSAASKADVMLLERETKALKVELNKLTGRVEGPSGERLKEYMKLVDSGKGTSLEALVLRKTLEVELPGNSRLHQAGLEIQKRALMALLHPEGEET